MMEKLLKLALQLDIIENNATAFAVLPSRVPNVGVRYLETLYTEPYLR